MSKIEAVLKRLEDKENQTIGRMSVYNGLSCLFTCVTLEPSWENNKNSISSIPLGKYRCIPRTSDKYGKHWHVVDVEGRTLILIHHGNFRKDTRGCILVGKTFFDIDKDGNKDITYSKLTMDSLLRKIGFIEFTLDIV
jgi:hypothetical protein